MQYKRVLSCLFACVAVTLVPPIDVSQATTENSIACIARAIHNEARGEPTLGKYAVGHVVMNRVHDSRFPSRVCDVVFARGQFTGILSASAAGYVGDESAIRIAQAVYKSGSVAFGGLPCKAVFFATSRQPYMGAHVRIGHHYFACGKHDA